VADYEAQLAAVRADAQTRVEAARATLEAERTEQIAAANARIADKRGAAAAEVDAAKQAARGQVESAVADVSTRLSELATGRRPSDDAVQRAVGEAMNQAVSA
jgi:F-type H+-transporting ATPase subunit b